MQRAGEQRRLPLAEQPTAAHCTSTPRQLPTRCHPGLTQAAGAHLMGAEEGHLKRHRPRLHHPPQETLEAGPAAAAARLAAVTAASVRLLLLLPRRCHPPRRLLLARHAAAGCCRLPSAGGRCD